MLGGCEALTQKIQQKGQVWVSQLNPITQKLEPSEDDKMRGIVMVLNGHLSARKEEVDFREWRLGATRCPRPTTILLRTASGSTGTTHVWVKNMASDSLHGILFVQNDSARF